MTLGLVEELIALMDDLWVFVNSYVGYILFLVCLYTVHTRNQFYAIQNGIEKVINSNWSNKQNTENLK